MKTIRPVVKLTDLPDVLSMQDLAALLQKNPRYFERLCALERQTGHKLLPDSIPGMGHRFTKEAVGRWLKRGVVMPRDLRRVS